MNDIDILVEKSETYMQSAQALIAFFPKSLADI
jgi:hypothetical protein